MRFSDHASALQIRKGAIREIVLRKPTWLKDDERFGDALLLGQVVGAGGCTGTVTTNGITEIIHGYGARTGTGRE